MAKLSFNNPLMESYEESTTRKSRRRNPDLIRNEDGGNASQEGLTADYTRFSVICKVKNVKMLKDYAYTKRITVKQAMDEVIEKFFDDYNSNPKNEKLLDHTRGK